MKKTLLKSAMALKSVFDRLQSQDSNLVPMIDPYIGYSTPDGIVVRGRVLAFKPAAKVLEKPSLWQRMKTMASLFDTDEMDGVTISAGQVSAVSDEEGYFTLNLPHSDASGWQTVSAIMADYDIETDLPVMVSDAHAEYGVISDIDDTVLKTDAWVLHRNLWTTFTGTSESRHIFPDAVALMNKLHAGINPVFYVSSSPWNLHAFLDDIFDRTGLVQGPKFLRDYGIGENQLITSSHGHHKGDAIDTILAANPELTFILMGDTGQHDSEVYYDAIQRHSNRIKQVILRVSGPRVDDKDNHWIDKIKTTNVPIAVVKNYDGLNAGGLS